MPFIFIGFLSLFISIFLIETPIIAGIGFISIYFYLSLWFFCLSSENPKRRKNLFFYYIELNITLAGVTALFAIYQYFIDPTLFGVHPHPIYGYAEELGTHYTRRATSYIGSPQNLGVFLALMWGFIRLSDKKKLMKKTLSILLFIGGILSGSGAFIGLLLIFLYFYYIRTKRFRRKWNHFIKVFILVLIASVVISMQAIDDLGNTIFGAFKLVSKNRISDYRLGQYFENMRFHQYFIGNGLGVADRLVLVYSGGNPPEGYVGKGESYIMRILFEIGIFGLLGFLVLFVSAAFRSFKESTHLGKVSFAILIALFFNLLVTPSFTGLTMSYIVWPFILFPIFVFSSKTYDREKSIEMTSIQA